MHEHFLFTLAFLFMTSLFGVVRCISFVTRLSFLKRTLPNTNISEERDFIRKEYRIVRFVLVCVTSKCILIYYLRFSCILICNLRNNLPL